MLSYSLQRNKISTLKLTVKNVNVCFKIVDYLHYIICKSKFMKLPATEFQFRDVILISCIWCNTNKRHVRSLSAIAVGCDVLCYVEISLWLTDARRAATKCCFFFFVCNLAIDQFSISNLFYINVLTIIIFECINLLGRDGWVTGCTSIVAACYTLIILKKNNLIWWNAD